VRVVQGKTAAPTGASSARKLSAAHSHALSFSPSPSLSIRLMRILSRLIPIARAVPCPAQAVASGGFGGEALVHSVREKTVLSRLALTAGHPPPTGSDRASLGQLVWSALRPAIVGCAYDDGSLAIFDVAGGSGGTAPLLACWPGLHGGGGAGGGAGGFLAPAAASACGLSVYGALSFSPLSHMFLASAGRDGRLVFCDYASAKVVKELDPGNGTITSFCCN